MSDIVPPQEQLKILIADDAPTDRMVLKRFVEVQGHTPLLAEDGLQAIELFDTESPDIVLLDAIMPNMDGFETAQYIKAHSKDRFVPIIFLTSLSEADSLARCLEVGGDDFLTKPYQKVILQAKINAFHRMLTMHATLLEQHDVIAQHNERLLHEQRMAKQTFEKIAHDGLLSAPNLQYRLSPMAVFNGDVLLAALRPNGNLCVLLGDFTGHGLAAAIGAMPLSQTFYSMVSKGFTMRDILKEINRKLKETLPLGVFCCAIMIDMDMRNKSLELWSGGMPAAYLYRQQEQRYDIITAKHLALGILPAESFSARTQSYSMANGDRLFLWSDGVLEAENSDGEMFGEDRVQALFNSEASADIFDRLNSAINQFSAERRSDDLSLVEVQMVDYSVFEEQGFVVPKQVQAEPAHWSFMLELKPDSLRFGDSLPLLQQILVDLPGLRPHSGELFTALSELYSNALEHGVLGLDSAIKAKNDGFNQYYRLRQERLNNLQQGFIRFAIDYHANAQQSHLVVQVTDSGQGFDYKTLYQNQDLENYFGRGLKLIHAICHSVQYQGRGNQVKVEFKW